MSVFTYPVPIEGFCGSAELADEPYDLRPILGVIPQNESGTRQQLLDLKKLLEKANTSIGADWLGVYQKAINPAGEEVLVKLAYTGIPSRAEFPLTPEYAELSNNTAVALSGEEITIPSVRNYQGAYYTCDSKVNSESCLPIISPTTHKVLGIVDAESFTDGYFTSEKVQYLRELCQQLEVKVPLSVK